MKLALVSDALDPTNGWGHHAVQVARGLIARGVDVRLVSPRAQAAVPDLRAFPDQADIPSFQQGVRHPVRLLLAALPRLRAAFRGADAVHVIVEPYAPAAVLAAGRRPVFVSLAGTYARPSSRPGVEGLLLRWALGRARRLIPVSRYTAARVAADTGFTHLTVVPHGINASEFQLVAPPPREPGLLVSVGEVKPRKGYALAIEALATVRARVPHARYTIVGGFRADAPYVQALRRQIDALGLARAVEFAGHVAHAEKLRLYHRAAALVMPYREAGGDVEGFGLVLLEAGACGLPVISARDSPAVESVDDEDNGLLVDPCTPAAVAEALVRVLTEPALAARLAEGGRRRAAAMTWDRAVRQLLDAYAGVLGTPLAPERAV